MLWPKALFEITLALWIGGHAFFSLVVAPQIFAHFARSEAGRIVAAIFPTYFAVGSVFAALVFILAIWQRHQVWLGGRPTLVLTGLALALTLVGGFILQPKIHALRLAMYESGAVALRHSFAVWHGISLVVNLGVILTGIIVLARIAGRS